MRRGTKHSSISLLKPSPRSSALRGYYNRQRKIFSGLYIFVLEDARCFTTEEIDKSPPWE